MVKKITDLIMYNNYLKKNDELPHYISFRKYQELRTVIKPYYDKVKMPNKRNEFLAERDLLLIDFLWATGGRIGDIISITKDNIDFRERLLSLYVKKSRRIIIINLDDELMYNLSLFLNKYPNLFKLFDITSAAAWLLLRKYGKIIGLTELHAHMFRHGLALYLLSLGKSISLISYRLGHRNTDITMKMYLKVTPEIEKIILKDVQFR